MHNNYFKFCRYKYNYNYNNGISLLDNSKNIFKSSLRYIRYLNYF